MVWGKLLLFLALPHRFYPIVMGGDKHRRTQQRVDQGFRFWLGACVSGYAGFVFLLIIACVSYVVHRGLTGGQPWKVFSDPLIWESVKLTYVTCFISALLSIFVAVPVGFVLSRSKIRGRRFVDALIDVPMVLPPLVVGLALLILFTSFPPGAGLSLDNLLGGVAFEVEAVVLAQFVVAGSFAIRSMKIAYDQLDSRYEVIARSLGAGRGRVFFSIVLPQVKRSVFSSFAVAWARALGEFGPILVFAGATRGKTEVLSTSVFLELNVGRLEGAVMVALLMIVMAMMTLAVVRFVVGEEKR